MQNKHFLNRVLDSVMGAYAITHMLCNIFVCLPHRNWTGLKGLGDNKHGFGDIFSLVTSENESNRDGGQAMI